MVAASKASSTFIAASDQSDAALGDVRVLLRACGLMDARLHSGADPRKTCPDLLPTRIVIKRGGVWERDYQAVSSP